MAMLDDIKTALDTASVTGGATGWECYLGWAPPTPDKAVLCFEMPGQRSPEVDPNAQKEYDWAGLQVVIRGDKMGYSAARTKAQAVFNALHDAAPSGFVYIFARHSPVSLGYDENNRPSLSINFEVMRARE